MDFHNSIPKRCFLSIVLLACTLVSLRADAKSLTVGGSMGWTNFDAATSASPDYSTWVTAQSVNVGDVLVFNYAKNFHDVYLLPTKAAFDACTFTTGKSVAPASAGTYSWTAPSIGLFYFACSFGGEGSSHCQAGQKLAVNVVSAAATSPAAAPVAEVPVAAPILVPVMSPVPIIVPIPTPTPAPTAPVRPNVTAPAPAPAAPANLTAPVPAPTAGGGTNATNASSPAPAPVVVLVPTPVPAAPVIPAPVPAPKHAPRPAPHHAPRPAPKHAPHPSPKHSPHHAPAPSPYLGPPAPPMAPTAPEVDEPSPSPSSTENDNSHAGVTSPLQWRSLILVISLMTAFLVL